jgi:hypothetical protein
MEYYISWDSSLLEDELVVDYLNAYGAEVVETTKHGKVKIKTEKDAKDLEKELKRHFNEVDFVVAA